MRGSRGAEGDSKIEHFLSEVKRSEKKVRGSRGVEDDSKIEHGFLNEVKKTCEGWDSNP